MIVYVLLSLSSLSLSLSLTHYQLLYLRIAILAQDALEQILVTEYSSAHMSPLLLSWILPFLYEDEKVPLFLSCFGIWLDNFQDLFEIKCSWFRLQAYIPVRHFDPLPHLQIRTSPWLLSDSSVSS